MSEAAWNKAFTQGSRALQDRLKKVHASNPKFQAWMQKSGHGAGASVKQASKEVKPSARVKSLQTKSLQAYGATKGTKVGGEHGSGDMRDTIAPLTRDQHSKVQAAERAAKAAAKKATPAKPKKPLSQAERMAAIAKAAKKAKSKDRFDVPTVNPDDVDHDDLRDVHQSLHVRRGYNEEVEQIDELDQKTLKSYIKKNVDSKAYEKSPNRDAGLERATAKVVRNLATSTLKNKVSNLKYTSMAKHKNPFEYQASRDELANRKVSEEVELDEVTKQEAEKMLGGPVKTRTGSEPKGKLPLGFRRARNLARKAIKTVKESTTEVSEVNEMNHGKKLAKMIMAKQSQHSIAQNMGEENIVEQDDSMEKKEMAQTQLHFIKYAAEEILEFIDMGGEIEEWYQNKLSKVQSEVESLHSYIEGEKRRTGMVEETEQVDEKINLVKAKMGDVVKDFYKSKAPQFKGKSMAKRREMAVAAKLGAEREAGMREEVEQIDERNMENKAKKNVMATKLGVSTYVYGKGVGVSKYDHEPSFKADPAGFKKVGRSVMQSPKTTSSQVTALKKANEEVEQIDEQSPAEIKAKYYHDQFDKVKPVKAYDKEGKLVGRYRSMNHAKQMKPGHTYKVEEEVEQTDEAVRVVDRFYPGVPHDAQKRKDIAATVKKIRKDPDARGGMTGFNRYQDFFGGRKARLGAERTPVGEEVEQVTEAEGKVAVTPKEKDLAAHHGDKTRITYGDVIKARLKSAAAKKMGKK